MSFHAEFTLDGGDPIEVISCSYSFGQALDDKGRPASNVHGGTINVVIASPEKDELLGWMIDPYKKSQGSIVFNKIDQESSRKELKFEEAYLVAFSESFQAESSEPMTASLSISARKITVGNSTYETKW